VGDVLPQRSNEPDCLYFLRNGRCKYGPSCKYHHPLDGRKRSFSGSSDGASQYYNSAMNGQTAQLFVTESGSQIMMVGRGGGGYEYGPQSYGYAPPPIPGSVGSPMMTPMGVVSVPSSYETASSLDRGGSYPGDGWYGAGEGGPQVEEGVGQGLPSLYPPATTGKTWTSKFNAHSNTNSTASTSSHGTLSPLGELSPTSAPWEGNIASVPSVPASNASSRRPSATRNSGEGGGEVTPILSNESFDPATSNINSTWSVDGSPLLAPSSVGGSSSDVETKEVEGEKFDQGIHSMTSALLDILDFSGGGGGSKGGKGPQHLRRGDEIGAKGVGSGGVGGPEGPPQMGFHPMQHPGNQKQGPHRFGNMAPQYCQQRHNSKQSNMPPQYHQQQQMFYAQQQQSNGSHPKMHGQPPLHPGMNHMEDPNAMPPYRGGSGGLEMGGNIFDMGPPPPPVPQALPTWAAQVMGEARSGEGPRGLGM